MWTCNVNRVLNGQQFSSVSFYNQPADDAARISAGELMNLIFDDFVKDLGITAMMANLVVDVGSCLLLD